MTRYLGIGKETEYGTPVEVTKYVDLISESIVASNEVIYPETAQGRDLTKQVAGPFKIGGPVNVFAEPENLGLLLLAAFGSVTSEVQGTTAYKHEFKPADALGSLTLEIGHDTPSTARKIAGCKVDKLTIEAAVKELVSASFDVVGKTEEITTPGTPEFSELPPFVFHQGTASIAGTPNANVKAFSVTLENKLQADEGYRITPDRTIQVLDIADLLVKAKLDLAFASTDEYKRFLGNATAVSPADTLEPVALNLKCEGAVIEDTYKYTFEIDLPKVIYDTTNANINKRDLIVQGVEATALKDETVGVGYSIMATLINKVTSY